MTLAATMKITLRLPARTLFEGTAVKLFAVAEDGAFGILPNHIDFVTALIPGILSLTSDAGVEQFFGVDRGILVKRGHQVEVAIRRGVQDDNLDTLHSTVTRTFMQIDEEEREARSAFSRLEADIVRRFGDLRKPRA